MNIMAASLKEAIIRVLDELPSDRVAEVLDFALFLKRRSQAQLRQRQETVVKTMPAAHLDALVGLVAWGGDALADTERVYEA
jgi:hypothetical protein